MLAVDLNRIHHFLRIVELGNISRAAEALGERKAKLSRNLALLERDLGVQLVYRTTRQFQLTEAGVGFYQEMKENFGNLEASILHIMKRDEEVEGMIRLTAPEDVGNHILTPIVNDFCNLHPKASFELIYTNQVLDMVKLGIDIAFRIGNLKDSTLIQKKVGSVEAILVAAPSYLEKARPLDKPEDLEGHSTIGFSTTRKHIWRLSSQGASRAISVHPRFVANNYITVRDLALIGRGIAFLPRFLADPHIAKGGLVHVLRHWRNEGAPVQVAMPNQKNVAKRIRKFFDYSTRRLGEVL